MGENIIDQDIEKCNEGWTPLHYAAQKGNKKIVEILIANGADVNALNADGQQPLYQAAGFNHRDVAELLISKGADVNAKDKDGDTALQEASTYLEMLELLIANGADVNATNVMGTTKLHRIASGGYGKQDRELHMKSAALLVAKGADVNAKDNSGKTPLHCAARWGAKEIAELLIATGANVNIKDNNGHTPLHKAAGNYHVFEFIAAFINAKGEKDVHFFQKDNMELAGMLIDHGANVNSRDNSDRTPLRIAVDKEFMDMAELLKINGATL